MIPHCMGTIVSTRPEAEEDSAQPSAVTAAQAKIRYIIIQIDPVISDGLLTMYPKLGPV